MKALLLVIAIVGVSVAAWAQESPPASRTFLSIESVHLMGGGLVGLDRRAGISSAAGFATMAEVRAHVSETFYLSISGGYGRMGVDESDPITAWNWGYWNRLYRNYIVLWLGSDSAYFNGQLQSLRAISNPRLTSGRWTGKDSLYSVQLTPQQYMNTYPLALTFGARWQATEALELSGGVSLIVVPFERNLYLEESWSKRRRVDVGPDSGSFTTFDYQFRNFANPRRGTAWGGGVNGSATVDLGSGFSAFASAQLLHFTSAIRADSYALLPVRRMVAFGAGVQVRY